MGMQQVSLSEFDDRVDRGLVFYRGDQDRVIGLSGWHNGDGTVFCTFDRTRFLVGAYSVNGGEVLGSDRQIIRQLVADVAREGVFYRVAFAVPESDDSIISSDGGKYVSSYINMPRGLPVRSRLQNGRIFLDPPAYWQVEVRVRVWNLRCQLIARRQELVRVEQSYQFQPSTDGRPERTFDSATGLANARGIFHGSLTQNRIIEVFDREIDRCRVRARELTAS